MADDDGYFKEEFGRRTIEISGLRGDLEDAKDRVTDAHDRTETLHQHIAKLHTEISFRQVKTAELEGSVISGRNRDAAAARQLDADRAACAAEVARLKQGVAESQDAQRVAEVEGQDARSRAELLDSECGAVRARLEALRREAERVREELIRDEAAEEARQVRLGTQAREQGTQRVAEAKDAMEGDMAEVAAARAQVERLEKGLALEKECAAGLNTALQHTLEKNGLFAKECEALRREAEVLESRKSEEGLQDALLAAKLRCQQLTQEVNGTKREALMQTQTLQGALEETRRMFADHEEQKKEQLEETQRCPSASPLAVLIASLADAKKHTAEAEVARRRLEVECGALEREVQQAEASVREERDRAGQERATEVEAELAAVRRGLEATSREAGAAQEEARRAESLVAEAERGGEEKEAMLRGKLEELWRALQQVRPKLVA
mmetsp:Transcript_164757/g.528600  ORF Transcript_164757/g.528600 Transcript_164757/m.528600 type:complete len:440 (-) Transcript_164757:80-1399(-)